MSETAEATAVVKEPKDLYFQRIKGFYQIR